MRLIIKLLCLYLLIVFIIQPVVFKTETGMHAARQNLKSLYWWMSPLAKGW
jgi:hypothetical protein